MKEEKNFTPFRIGACEIPNKLVVPAMVANMIPHELTVIEIHQSVKDFGNTAANAIKAGLP